MNIPRDVLDTASWQLLLANARAGVVNAQALVAYYYEFGAESKLAQVTVKPNRKNAIRWATKAAQKGDVAAQSQLSRLLSDGNDVDDFEAAILWSKKAIAQGSASDAHNLGAIYRDLGKRKLAFKYYALAVDMGSEDSLIEMGICYVLGFGVSRNTKLAMQCFMNVIKAKGVTSAASQDNAHYWIALISIFNQQKKVSFPTIRKHLECANIDDDHDAANDILNVLGKVKYMVNRTRK